MTQDYKLPNDCTDMRDEARKAEVVGNARSDAIRRNLPADPLGRIWEDLVETSIAYELVEWDRLREGN